ncbi:polymerase delta interacting protein 3 [Echinococcus multilocularis]|uniref:Polymerase delta interacting protein 3 n=1 Tax=Echinococcus multilocularis TaxID=6211 RepID=A0A087VY09_ECHMU|nr:polymerase delta interacting protein 3 [Echinococcus multilocularis]
MVEDTFEKRLVRKPAKDRLGSNREDGMNIRRQNMSTDLRIKILNNLRGAPRRIDARRLLMPKRQFSRRLKNHIPVSKPGLTQEVNVPFLIPRRTITNEYFRGVNPIPLTRQWSSSAISTSRPLMRTVENKPTGAGMLAQGSTVDSTISPIQGFRVEAKNLLPSVTIDDVYELFSGVGSLRSCNLVHPGQAEVIFNSPQDAQSAVTRYNGRELDGRPMIVTLTTPLASSSTTTLKGSALKSSGGFAAAVQNSRAPSLNGRGNLNRDIVNRAWNRNVSNFSRPVVFHVNL